MKKTILLLMIFVLITSAIFAQIGDARTRGMANAFTAVADDYNALYFNPAGLAYLNNSDFVLGLGGNASGKKGLTFLEEEYPSIWESWENDGYEYEDSFFGHSVYFDPADYGFFWDDDPDTATMSYQEAVDAYEQKRTFEIIRNLSDMNLYPRLAYAAPHWGVSTINNVTLEPSGFDPETEEFFFRILKETGIMGGLGLNIGPIAAGLNIKYFKEVVDSSSFTVSETEDGPPEDFFQDIFFGSDNEEATSDHKIEAGLGFIFTLGSLNLGAYLDNLLFFIEETDDGVEVDPGLLDTLSVGAAWTPFDQKMKDQRGILNFIAAVDLKNLGSRTERELAAGVEAGINLGGVIVGNARLGYTQPLVGALADIADQFDPRLGLYSMGMGWKFLFAAINFSLQIPYDTITWATGTMDDEDRASHLGTAIVDIHFTF
ncbi:MAG: hypothetical protein JW760_02490 [Spirochaetales bacterium]|nr:hypothetical protein [Spirochaetales bacterium]